MVLTDIKFEKNKIVFMLNGGPDLKHRFLRHIQLGTGGTDDADGAGRRESEPTGARLTLEFKGGVPSMTGFAGEGAARAADFVRREDADPGIY